MTKAFHWANLKLMVYNTPFPLDRNSSSGGIMLFVSEDIAGKLIASCFYLEMNLRKQKWLISYSYNPNKSMMGQHKEADDDDELFL